MNYKIIRRMFAVISIFAMLLPVSLLSGCGKNTGNSGKLTVAVSIVPQKGFIEAICGDLVDVITMIPPGHSHETYEPTPVEMEKFSSSAIYFTAGIPTEKANILPKAKNIKVIDLPAIVAAVYPDIEVEPGERDPHIWLSPRRAKVMVGAMADEMVKLDPDNAQTYKANAELYISRIEAADTQLKALFDKADNKKFIVYHPAFAYFADEYGLTMYAVEEEGKEVTAERLQSLIDLAKAEGIKTIFSQAEIDSRMPDAFAEEVGGRKVMLEPMAYDYVENMLSMGEAIAASMER